MHVIRLKCNYELTIELENDPSCGGLIVPLNIDGKELTEIYLQYYDIFVKYAFGNYREILAE